MSEQIRKRLTFLFPENDKNFDDGLKFAPDGSHVDVVKNLNIPRQDRITIPASAVDFGFLITYSRELPFFTNVPFTLVREPGWHVMVPPDAELDHSELSNLFKHFHDFNIDLEKLAVKTPNWKSYYTPGAISLLGDQIISLLSPTKNPSYLESIDSLSISYGYLPLHPLGFQKPDDLVLDVYISRAKSDRIINSSSDKIEVGLFTVSSAYSDFEDNDWALGGVIRNLDKADFEKSLVHVWPRHRKAAGSVSAAFDAPIGLHPHHRLYFKNLTYPQGQPAGSCKLYAEYTVPKALFLDRYQLADLDRRTETSAATGQLVGVWGETDLEAPVWAVDGWGSEALVEIYYDSTGDFDFELPMHSRYEVPLNNSFQQNRTMPWPAVMWACQDLDLRPSPDIKSLGYESFFPDDTVFYHVAPDDDAPLLQTPFHIPVAPWQYYNKVQTITTLTLLVGFVWILFNVIGRSRQTEPKANGNEKLTVSSSKPTESKVNAKTRAKGKKA